MSILDAPAGKRKLPTNEAASYLGVSASTLNKMRHFGGGPKFIAIGTRVVYDPADLDHWCEGRKRASTSDATLQGAA
ncbi:helix-turn-helix domain-containing protein [uncultured Bosea sp.]|uniref:helix-turn-helix transcriptional regulator n=1 Tax=uncultured Bosea sp. TaxID=211457 RepID=UPI0025E61BD5|nr:helix-turn-helix domain-containing protein [uncultured Bosea sp.]